MITKYKTSIAACLAACLSFSASVYATTTTFDYATTPNSQIQFAGDGTFTITPGANSFKVTDGTAAGLLGEITGTFTIGAITTSGTVSSAPVTGTGTLVIHDGLFDLTATVQWVDIVQHGTLDFLNTSGTVNLTGITYSGTNPDLVALKAAGTAVNVFSFQFTPAVALTDLKGSPNATSFSGTITANPPTCSCTLSFNGALPRITNCAGQAIPDITASQDCGSGTPTPVTLDSVSAVTNGTCPQIITRTAKATDGCGTLHTFVQTITLNCKANCAITPSVATTIVGTSGLTASVADAGVGATYVWNVINGTITAGQGTPTITITAGANTSIPLSIMIEIISPAGCESDCTASVGLTQPPTTNLGHGDTATIGFWHNKNGQGLILGAGSPSLAGWLSSNFPCMYGNLVGKSDADVAALFLTDFNVKGQKTYAQVLGGALACYFTSSSLGGGSGPAGFGFNISPGGTGSKTFNVGSQGTAIGLLNNTSYTVLQILAAANANTNCSNGVINPAVFNALNTIFDGINSGGDIN